MEIKLGRKIPFVNLEISIHRKGTQCNIGVNQTVMENLSEEDQDKVTDELEKAFQNITKILEKQN